ncbi:MAG TPA: hypothetical protein VHV78_00470 [Gemmatimonadaceae bacterium]|nr:hypothetical protein [Gemmatimonadaceae bacterium]
MFFMALLLVAQVSSSPVGDSVAATHATSLDSTEVMDTLPRRRRAIEYSDWYARRLEVHRIGSYLELPLFGAEYVLGNQLLHGADRHSVVGSSHFLVASGIGVLFTVNTVTGAWNWWDSRSDPSGRTRRTIHSLLMLASDAGFVWTGAIAGQAKLSNDDARRHRNVALGSIGLSTAGTVMMWLWKN